MTQSYEQYKAQLEEVRNRTLSAVHLIPLIPRLRTGFLEAAFKFVDVQISSTLSGSDLGKILEQPTAVVLKSGRAESDLSEIELANIRIWIFAAKQALALSAYEKDPQVSSAMLCEGMLTNLQILVDAYASPQLSFEQARRFLTACEDYAGAVGDGLETFHYEDFLTSMAQAVTK